MEEEFKTEVAPQEKARHGCVTAWLVFSIIVNSLMSLGYLFASETIADKLNSKVSPSVLIVFGFLGLLNVLFAAVLFKWKKWGFYGFCGSALIIFCINISCGVGVVSSVMGLSSIGILYAILQIQENNKTAWENLE